MPIMTTNTSWLAEGLLVSTFQTFWGASVLIWRHKGRMRLACASCTSWGRLFNIDTIIHFTNYITKYRWSFFICLHSFRCLWFSFYNIYTNFECLSIIRFPEDDFSYNSLSREQKKAIDYLLSRQDEAHAGGMHMLVRLIFDIN